MAWHHNVKMKFPWKLAEAVAGHLRAHRSVRSKAPVLMTKWRQGVRPKFYVLNSIQNWALGQIDELSVNRASANFRVMWLSKVCTQRFLPIFSDLEFRLCSSKPLQVGASFHDNYLLSERDYGKTVLVPPKKKFDVSAFDSVKTWSWFSTMGENFCFQDWRIIEPVGF